MATRPISTFDEWKTDRLDRPPRHQHRLDCRPISCDELLCTLRRSRHPRPIPSIRESWLGLGKRYRPALWRVATRISREAQAQSDFRLRGGRPGSSARKCGRESVRDLDYLLE